MDNAATFEERECTPRRIASRENESQPLKEVHLTKKPPQICQKDLL